MAHSPLRRTALLFGATAVYTTRTKSVRAKDRARSALVILSALYVPGTVFSQSTSAVGLWSFSVEPIVSFTAPGQVTPVSGEAHSVTSSGSTNWGTSISLNYQVHRFKPFIQVSYSFNKYRFGVAIDAADSAYHEHIPFDSGQNYFSASSIFSVLGVDYSVLKRDRFTVNSGIGLFVSFLGQNNQRGRIFSVGDDGVPVLLSTQVFSIEPSSSWLLGPTIRLSGTYALTDRLRIGMGLDAYTSDPITALLDVQVLPESPIPSNYRIEYRDQGIRIRMILEYVL